MWTAEHRARHKGAVRKERQGYPTDITDGHPAQLRQRP
jgi:hypothetical protein